MSDPFRLGQHDAKLEALDIRCSRIENTLDDVNNKLDVLLTAAAERKGGMRVIAAVATAAGGLGSLLMSVVLKLWDK